MDLLLWQAQQFCNDYQWERLRHDVNCIEGLSAILLQGNINPKQAPAFRRPISILRERKGEMNEICQQVENTPRYEVLQITPKTNSMRKKTSNFEEKATWNQLPVPKLIEPQGLSSIYNLPLQFMEFSKIQPTIKSRQVKQQFYVDDDQVSLNKPRSMVFHRIHVDLSSNQQCGVFDACMPDFMGFCKRTCQKTENNPTKGNITPVNNNLSSVSSGLTIKKRSPFQPHYRQELVQTPLHHRMKNYNALHLPSNDNPIK